MFRAVRSINKLTKFNYSSAAQAIPAPQENPNVLYSGVCTSFYCPPVIH